jgi:hypothetical protein
MSGYQVNPWVTFTRKYGPIPSNDNMYDETIQRSARRNGVAPLRFDTGAILEELLANFRQAAPSSIVLTGTAGDGKTYLCREVWQALGGGRDAWDSDAKLRKLDLPGGGELRVIKDLSELSVADAELLLPMAEAVLGKTQGVVFLVAANDGQLLQAWDRMPPSGDVQQVRQRIEDLLVKGELKAEDAGVWLYNLSRQSSADGMRRVLDALLAHPGWQGCEGCQGKNPGISERCPIWENYERLQQPLVRERLNDLLELCDHTGIHLPIRQLLILASNMLLGHPEAKDHLLRCQDVRTIVHEEKTPSASVYRNTFGGNLPASRRSSVEVFQAIGRFGVGEETSNRVDSLLVYGPDDPRRSAAFDELLRNDPIYGAHKRYFKLQRAYLDGAGEEDISEFNKELVSQRQRLFFSIPNNRAEEYGLWELMVFQSAGNYLNRVVRPASRGERIERKIVGHLVRGLNRVFTGMLTNDEHTLYLASSGSYSHARVSRIVEHEVPAEPKLGAKIVVESKGNSLLLCVFLDRNTRLALPLNLVRYEFLCRVAEGALPTNFSRECYEDILSFKSRLLRAWRELSEDDEETDLKDQLSLGLLELNREGQMSTNRISIQLPQEENTHG